MSAVVCRKMDYNDEVTFREFTALLKRYYRDPMGSGNNDCPMVDERIIEGLKHCPNSFVFLAILHGEVVGGATCFEMFSTFRMTPTVNIHDIFVNDDIRGKGVGSSLLVAIEAYTKRIGGSKLTLEVREDNVVAQYVYTNNGFAPESVNMLFWTKYL